MSKINVPLLKKVRSIITRVPSRFDMYRWGICGTRDNLKILYNDPPSCGTVCCFAGWLILADQPRSKWPSFFKKSPDVYGNFPMKNLPSIRKKAARKAGIPFEELNPIFLDMTKSADDIVRYIDMKIEEAAQ